MKWHVTYAAARPAGSAPSAALQARGGGLKLFDDKEGATAFARDCTKKGFVAKVVAESELYPNQQKYRTREVLPVK
jgi:hypothetical protein